MDLRERKQIINGATEKLPEYAEGKPNYWLHGASSKDAAGMVTTGTNFLGSAINSFGPVKSAGDILQESGTSVGQGSGFSYQKQNSVDVGAQMDELSKQNTANTLNTAASGASLGSAFGPIGAGIGGVVGGAVGFIGGLFRKNKMAERIRQAQIQAVRNNDFNLASAQTDYLTNQYNVEHDNTQDDMLYAAEDGKKPLSPLDNAMKQSGFVLKNGKYVFDGHAMMSNGEAWGHINRFTGEVLDLHKVGRGRDNKDTVKVKMGDTPEEVRSTFVVTNKGGASQYTLATGDVAGGLQIGELQKMDGHNKVAKAIRNGVFDLPTDILTAKCGKLPRFVNTKFPDFEDSAITKSQQQITMSPYEQFFKNTTDAQKRSELGYQIETPLTEDQKSSFLKSYNNINNLTKTTSDNSNWANAITSGMGILGGLSQILQAKNEPLNRPNIEAQNPYERQSLAVAASLSPNTNAKLAEMAHAEARNRYNLNRMGGLSGAQKYLASVAGGVGLQENIAKVLGLDQQERNGYKMNWSKLAADLGAATASRKMTANQYLEEAYARSHGARTQMEQMGMQNMLAAFNQYYKNLDKLNRFNRTMAYYDQDYQLRKDALNRSWG